MPNDILFDKNFQRNLLIKYWGEGNVQTFNRECPYRLSGCSLEADCRCQNACVRSFRYAKDGIYCELKDRGILFFSYFHIYFEIDIFFESNLIFLEVIEKNSF